MQTKEPNIISADAVSPGDVINIRFTIDNNSYYYVHRKNSEYVLLKSLSFLNDSVMVMSVGEFNNLQFELVGEMKKTLFSLLLYFLMGWTGLIHPAKYSFFLKS